MTQHFINTVRKSIIGAILFVLPARPNNLAEPEPHKRSLLPDADAWLFNPVRPVEAYASDYLRGMDRVSDSLEGLRRVISAKQSSLDVSFAVDQYEPITVLSSDTVLFDGEPIQDYQATADTSGLDDFLFQLPAVTDVPYQQVVTATPSSFQIGIREGTRLAA